MTDTRTPFWFTLAVPPDSKIGLEQSIDLLGQMAGVDTIRHMPSKKFFKTQTVNGTWMAA